MEHAKIMVVEDDADIRQGIRILLESEDYAVAEAEDGEQALALFDDSFDLVILDVMMPRLSGIDTCRELRRRFNRENFYLCPDGLRFFWQMYAIAPAAEGIPTFFLPFSAEGCRWPEPGAF